MNPQNDEFYQKALIAYRKQNYDYAIELFQEVLKNYPDFDECIKYLLLSARKKKQLRKSSLLQTLIGYLTTTILSIKLFFAQSLQKDQEAISILKKIFFINPFNPSALYRLAMIYSSQGKVKLAIVVLEEIISFDQKHTPTLQALAQMYYKNNDHQKAKLAATKLLTIAPRNLTAENILKDIAAQSTIEKGFDDLKPAT